MAQLKHILTNAFCHSNNVALDIFNLYKEVMLRGGFKANEDYDQQGRWKGRINFAGEIFKKVHFRQLCPCCVNACKLLV